MEENKDEIDYKKQDTSVTKNRSKDQRTADKLMDDISGEEIR